MDAFIQEMNIYGRGQELDEVAPPNYPTLPFVGSYLTSPAIPLPTYPEIIGYPDRGRLLNEAALTIYSGASLIPSYQESSEIFVQTPPEMIGFPGEEQQVDKALMCRPAIPIVPSDLTNSAVYPQLPPRMFVYHLPLAFPDIDAGFYRFGSGMGCISPLNPNHVWIAIMSKHHFSGLWVNESMTNILGRRCLPCMWRTTGKYTIVDKKAVDDVAVLGAEIGKVVAEYDETTVVVRLEKAFTNSMLFIKNGSMMDSFRYFDLFCLARDHPYYEDNSLRKQFSQFQSENVKRFIAAKRLIRSSSHSEFESADPGSTRSGYTDGHRAHSRSRGRDRPCSSKSRTCSAWSFDD